ncbi:metal-dependent hydrolase [Bdellovibrionota bacterium FG-1]
MLPLGHMGVGSWLVTPATRHLRQSWVIFGAILPDLIDKPLYYGLSWSRGLSGTDLGLISCTRTFGHSGIVLLLVIAAGIFRQSTVLKAISWGLASHLALDVLADGLAMCIGPITERPQESSALIALAFPFYQARFSAAPFVDIGEHARASLNPISLISEVLGAGLLLRAYRRHI